jgi:hypothetical protein
MLRGVSGLQNVDVMLVQGLAGGRMTCRENNLLGQHAERRGPREFLEELPVTQPPGDGAGKALDE